MQVWAAASTGRADIPDELAFGDRDAGPDTRRKPVQMSISAKISPIVLEIDGLSVAAVPTSLHNDAVTDRPHRRAALGRKVNALMGQVRFQNRMKTRLIKM